MNFNFNPGGGAQHPTSADTGASTCTSGAQEPAGTVCILSIAFKPSLPGIRKGAVAGQLHSLQRRRQAEPTLYLFLSGIGRCGPDFAEQCHAVGTELQPEPTAEPDL